MMAAKIAFALQPVGQPSEPVRSGAGDGILVLMVCSREGGGGDILPINEQQREVRSRLMNERLSVASRQHLRNLKRAAFIDIRIGQ